MELNLHHPWQNGPIKLTRYAIVHLHRNTDFDRRLAFLLLDVGVETLFKTYLILPDKVTGAQGSFTERKKAAEGNFHELIIGVEKAAQTQIQDCNLSHVQYFHTLRNQLYHQGNGITVPFEHVYQYANLSIRLLNALLGVDLHDLLLQPDLQTQEQKRHQAELDSQEQEIMSRTIAIGKVRQKLEIIARNAVEKISYRLVLPSFEEYFDQFTNELHDKFRDSFGSINNWQSVFVNTISDHTKDEFELAHISNLVKKLISVPDNVTEFYLMLLQYVVANPNEINFPGIYSLSKHYPEFEQRGSSNIVGGDQRNPIYEYIFPTHNDILQAGNTWLIDLEYICRSIETWLKTPN